MSNFSHALETKRRGFSVSELSEMGASGTGETHEKEAWGEWEMYGVWYFGLSVGTEKWMGMVLFIETNEPF
jgi:hypothetical protein